jgi:hypothetical protein
MSLLSQKYSLYNKFVGVSFPILDPTWNLCILTLYIYISYLTEWPASTYQGLSYVSSWCTAEGNEVITAFAHASVVGYSAEALHVTRWTTSEVLPLTWTPMKTVLGPRNCVLLWGTICNHYKYCMTTEWRHLNRLYDNLMALPSSFFLNNKIDNNHYTRFIRVL